MSKELIEQLRELSAKRKPYATGAHGQMIGMESYRIVANGFALECIDEAADRIEELERLGDAANQAAEVLRQEATILCDCHTLAGEWDDTEPEVKANYDRMMALADRLTPNAALTERGEKQ